MPTGLLPLALSEDAAPPTDPQTVAEAFLAALATADLERASALVDDEIDYVNVGLPPVRGRDQMARVFRLFDRPGSGFEVYLHAISADGPVVLTERTDVLLIGPLRIQFWVWGRFDVHDGKITLWRDSFDFVDVLRGTVRGLVGALVPGLQPAAPSEVGAAPGR
jgi:limonene-1,2-epoxide hydrolase